MTATPGVAAARCATASAPRERPDVRLGKATSLRAGGVPVPRGATATDLDRLDALVQRTGSRRLVVLGDFIHAAKSRVPAFGRLTGLALVSPRAGETVAAVAGATLHPLPPVRC